ncbi:MAG: cytochrome c nitrite reductase small subunit [Phycisphaerales bacterium]
MAMTVSRRGGVSAKALLCIALGAVCGAGVYVMDASKATSYLSDDPNACVNCHVMRDELQGWQRGSHHAAATCNDCHTPHGGIAKWEMKAVHGMRHSYGFTFNNFHEPILIKGDSLKVVEENCIRCHAELVSDIGPSGIIAHARGPASTPTIIEGPKGEVATSQSCVHCHSHVGHGPTR